MLDTGCATRMDNPEAPHKVQDMHLDRPLMVSYSTGHHPLPPPQHYQISLKQIVFVIIAGSNYRPADDC